MSKHGFTLIELLVVVVIIGILASVAFPQYRHSILKSKFASLMPAARALADAQNAYYLETRHYASTIAELDFTPISTKKIKVTSELKVPNWFFAKAEHTDLPDVYLAIYYKNSKSFKGETHCVTKGTNKDGVWLCKHGLGGVFTDFTQDGYYGYRIGRGAGGMASGWDINSDGEINISDINGLIESGNLPPDIDRDALNECMVQVVLGNGDSCLQDFLNSFEPD